MTYVCITGNEQSPASLEQRIERVLASHPRVLCELRLDYLDLNPASAFSFLARLPGEIAPRLVLTQRLRASGPHASGRCGWDVMTWQSWWKDVMALRPWFAADLDWIVLDRLAGESLGWRGGKFRSRHSFFSLHTSLDEAEELLPSFVASAKEHSTGVKLACPVESARDLMRLSTLSDRIEGIPFKTVVAMGPAGRAWRWSHLSGTLTYFAADAGRSTASGQEEMAAVLPYLSSKQRPDLFLLLGDNPENRYGEQQWNRAFLRRGARYRYVNCATKDSPGEVWAGNMLQWMDKAHVRGASVTKPYKLCLPEKPVNTVTMNNGLWEFANTDGEGVLRLLQRSGLAPGAPVLIAGGGGAARAAQEVLVKAGYEAWLWVREGGHLGSRPAQAKALVSTWPGEYQEALVEALALEGPGDFNVVIDAQFSRPPSESPLARWAAAAGVSYVPGSLWWREQARLQDQIWLGKDRLGSARKAALDLVPASKSETLRALAIAAAFGQPAEIHGPALNEDTEAFVRALECLGVSVDRDGPLWRIFPPARLQPPDEPVHMGEGATGLRILGALSTLMEGTLRITGAARLLERPQEEMLSALGASREGNVLVIPCGRELPACISLERSSQFATGFLIAAAARIHRGLQPGFDLSLEGEARSLSYVRLTLELLKEAGISSELSDRLVSLRPAGKPGKLVFRIEKDASSLAFLETYGKRWGLSSFFTGMSRQGDSIFPQLLEAMLREPSVSLRHHPDLAPPLWAAAALFRRKLEIKDCPQLHLKESDRARLLVEAAEVLGGKGETRADGFLVDFSSLRSAAEEIFLRTDGDHRLAMAAGLLSTDDPLVGPDRRDCVKKSFPAFWLVLTLLEEAQPG